MTQAISTPRLSRVCLIAFAIASGFFVYELRTQGPFDLAFLAMGAIGCIYLLLLGGERYSTQHVVRSMPSQLRETPSGAPSEDATVTQRQRRSAQIADRRRNRSRSRWPQHLERRKTTRRSPAPIH